VIAPDLLGHGESAKPHGDYSLGAYANLVRDLLDALGEKGATLVGHSLGGGVAMQFAYQYPEHTERLVLVSSGGLGREVRPILRAAVVPGAELLLPWVSVAATRSIGAAVNALGRLGFRANADLAEASRGFLSLEESDARRAFLHTVRGIVDLKGQRVTAADKLYLAADIPTMIVWGENDRLIPARHAYLTHQAISGSRLELFNGAGHFPYLDDPERFAAILSDFIRTTQPKSVDSSPRTLPRVSSPGAPVSL
jgi:pimeloyl-ACP methyl ester carboxylesterase